MIRRWKAFVCSVHTYTRTYMHAHTQTHLWVELHVSGNVLYTKLVYTHPTEAVKIHLSSNPFSVTPMAKIVFWQILTTCVQLVICYIYCELSYRVLFTTVDLGTNTNSIKYKNKTCTTWLTCTRCISTGITTVSIKSKNIH